jgi:Ca2+-binding EF-hand superfamily protein
MLAQSAFEATDIQNDGKISLFELRFIIYAYEGKILENE